VISVLLLSQAANHLALPVTRVAHIYSTVSNVQTPYLVHIIQQNVNQKQLLLHQTLFEILGKVKYCLQISAVIQPQFEMFTNCAVRVVLLSVASVCVCLSVKKITSELVICSRNQIPGPGSKIHYPVPDQIRVIDTRFCTHYL